MFWYKSWLDTRWRFLIGLAILALSACAAVLGYHEQSGCSSSCPTWTSEAKSVGGSRESAELMRTYRGYVFSQWFQPEPDSDLDDFCRSAR